MALGQPRGHPAVETTAIQADFHPKQANIAREIQDHSEKLREIKKRQGAL